MYFTEVMVTEEEILNVFLNEKCKIEEIIFIYTHHGEVLLFARDLIN